MTLIFGQFINNNKGVGVFETETIDRILVFFISSRGFGGGEFGGRSGFAGNFSTNNKLVGLAGAGIATIGGRKRFANLVGFIV